MAQGREEPSGYDWEDRSVPAEPEPLALPDHRRDGPVALTDPEHPLVAPGAAGDPHDPVPETGPYGAPSFTYDPLPVVEESAARRGGLPAWAIVAIVLVQAVALVTSVALVVGGVERLTAEEPPAPTTAPSAPAPTPTAPPTASPEREPGTVTDSEGREVTDGTGGYDDPATVGEHTLSWRAWTEGTVSVAALEVDLDAEVPSAPDAHVVQDGYRLVLVTYEVSYDGPGQLAPAEELWLTGESDRTYFPDVAEGLVPTPMRKISPLQDGESATFHSAFLVPETEVESFRLGVETFTGEILYFATP